MMENNAPSPSIYIVSDACCAATMNHCISPITRDAASKEESMKIAYLTIVTLALLAVPETIAEEFDVPHVVAYGTATVEVSPNQMRWRLNVRNMDPTSMGAAKSHETTVAAVLDFLKQSKIAEGTIQTSRMQLGENWDYSRSERRTFST